MSTTHFESFDLEVFKQFENIVSFVVNKDATDFFSISWSKDFDSFKFCVDHSNLGFSEFKEVVEDMKKTNISYFEKYEVQGE